MWTKYGPMQLVWDTYKQPILSFFPRSDTNATIAIGPALTRMLSLLQESVPAECG